MEIDEALNSLNIQLIMFLVSNRSGGEKNFEMRVREVGRNNTPKTRPPTNEAFDAAAVQEVLHLEFPGK